MTTPQQTSEEANHERTLGTVMEFGLLAEEFALEQTLAGVDGEKFELERVTAHDPTGFLPYLRASGSNQKEIKALLADDPTVAAIEGSSNSEGEGLYRIRWAGQVTQLVEQLVNHGETILSAIGQNGSWTLRVVFPNRDILSEAYDSYVDAGLSVTVNAIYTLDGNAAERNEITDKQQVALSAADEHGYYDIPRRITAEELADKLGISHQALSERLRRAHQGAIQSLVNNG